MPRPRLIKWIYQMRDSEVGLCNPDGHDNREVQVVLVSSFWRSSKPKPLPALSIAATESLQTTPSAELTLHTETQRRMKANTSKLLRRYPRIPPRNKRTLPASSPAFLSAGTWRLQPPFPTGDGLELLFRSHAIGCSPLNSTLCISLH